MNKKGIELSVNFIVMLVLAIAMFMGGLIFFGRMMSGVSSMRVTLDSQTDQQIEAMLDSGGSFVIPIHSKDVNRNNYVTFGIGILNDGRGKTDTHESDYFSLNIRLRRATTRDNERIYDGAQMLGDFRDAELPRIVTSDSSDDEGRIVTINSLNVPAGSRHKEVVLFDVSRNVPSGQYIYSVNVQNSASYNPAQQNYEPGLQIILNVK